MDTSCPPRRSSVLRLVAVEPGRHCAELLHAGGGLDDTARRAVVPQRDPDPMGAEAASRCGAAGAVVNRDCHSGAMRSIEPGISRFRVWARSEEHTSELQSLMRISYAVFCLK